MNAFGINAYNLLSVALSNGDVTSLKSETCKEVPAVPLNKAPSATPVTVATPVTTTLLVLTSVSLAKDLKLLPRPQEASKSHFPKFKISN